jgi:hypothetical protein
MPWSSYKDARYRIRPGKRAPSASKSEATTIIPKAQRKELGTTGPIRKRPVSFKLHAVYPSGMGK